MKFLVPIYSCLRNAWVGCYRPQILVLSVLNWICWTTSEQNSWVGHWPQPLAVQVDRSNKTGNFYESVCSNVLEGFQSKRFHPPGDTLWNRWWLCDSVLCPDRPYMLELVDGNVTIWFRGTGGGYVFWELESHSCWCTGVGGIVLSLKDSMWESLGQAVGPFFRERRLCAVACGQNWI